MINAASPLGDRGPSGYNQPLSNTTSAIYDLPFGLGRRYGNSAPGWQQQLLGGWQLTGINVVTSGVPLNLTYTASSSQVVSTTSATYALRPNLLGSPRQVYGHNLVKTASSLNGYLVAGSAITVPTGTQLFGDAGRNVLRGPAFAQLDLAAHKRFALTPERVGLQFRLEAFNVLNSTNFISLTSNVATVNSTTGVSTLNSSFGTFTESSSVYPSRQVQVALRLEF